MTERTIVDVTDEELLRACQGGDTGSFAALWERHQRAGLTAARNIAPSLEAEDLVSESYLRIFELVSTGRGPTGAFRPYLYQVIRSVAAARLRTPETATAPADFESIPDLHEAGPWEDNAFDLNAVATAFATLTPRWQAALWYTEVEGMPPREAAPLLGTTANTAAALAVRARDGLRSAWVEAHVNQELEDAACATTLTHLQRYQRGKLTAKLTREVEHHLDTCANCSMAAAEYSTLNKRLGLTLALAIFGGMGASEFVRQLGLAGATVPGSTGAGPGPDAAAAATTGTSLGVSAAVVGGGVLALVGIVATSALAISLLTAPDSPNISDVISESEQATSEHSDISSGPNSDDAASHSAGDGSSATSETPPIGSDTPAYTLPSDTIAPVDPPVTPPVNPPIDPPITPPIDPGPTPETPDHSIAIGYTCLLPGDLMIGTANSYGVIRLRATAPGGAPVELLNPLYDPAGEGQPGNVFTGGVFTDPQGNVFDFGFYTGTDVTSGNDWHGSDPSTLPMWGTHFGGTSVNDVLIELRLVRPDGSYSPWTQVDTSVSCF